MFKPLLLSLTLALSGAQLAQAQDKTIKVVDVTDNIKMLTGRGGNIGLFTGADGTFMIDDKFLDLAGPIETAITKAGGELPKFLINTHWHGDHTGSNKAFADKGAVIVAHHNVRKRMSVDNVIEAFNMKSPASPVEALPIVTFVAETYFHMNGDEVHVRHVPEAHTDGDAYVYFTKANVLHTGDLFFNGFFPFIDTNHGGSLAGLIAAVDHLLEVIDENTRIIPGHGGLATKAELISYRDMLNTALDRLSSARAEGKTLDQVLAENPLKDLDGKWGAMMFNSHKWVGLIYESIGPKP